jgi:hypothetical protein
MTASTRNGECNMRTPHDLTPIEPASVVEDLCDRLAADIGSFSVGQELRDSGRRALLAMA